MIDSAAKVGVACLLLGAVWGLTFGLEKAGGDRLMNQASKEGVLVPEAAEEIEPIHGDIKHSSLVALSIPQVRAIDPGSVKIITPGYRLDDAIVRPILEYKKIEHPKPKSVLVLLDNSRSMVVKYQSYFKPGVDILPSDPEYRRLDACRLLLDSLSPTTDKVTLACFPCLIKSDSKPGQAKADQPFEVLTKWAPPSDASDLLDTMRQQENGSTPLFRGTEQAAKLLAAGPAGSQKVLVLLTDGMDTDGAGNRPDLMAEQKAIDAIRAAGIETYAIGLGPEADISTLKEMCSTVLKADDATALNRTFKQILHQLSREVVQIDLDATISRVGKPIAPGQPVEFTYRSNGKLYKSKGVTQ